MRAWILPLLFAASAIAQESDVYHKNVVMVVDASGSMAGGWSGTGQTKMDVAKEAMKTVLHQLGDETQVGIVVFGRVKNRWIYPLALKNNNAIEDAIDSIQTGGGTPLGTYIKVGADALVEQRAKQFGYGSYRLLIITDGEADSGSETRKMKEFTEEIVSRGINVNVIGAAMAKQHALAQIVGDHNYRAANDPQALQTAIQEVFAEVSKQDANDAASSFDLLEGLDPLLAKDMIGALAKPQNHPIGEQPSFDAPPRNKKLISQGNPADSDTGMGAGSILVVVVIGIVVLGGIIGGAARH